MSTSKIHRENAQILPPPTPYPQPLRSFSAEDRETHLFIEETLNALSAALEEQERRPSLYEMIDR